MCSSYLKRKTDAQTGIAKKNRIHDPNGAMREIHSRLIRLLRDQEHWPRWLIRSTAENIQPHLGNRFFYQIDIRNAFESVRVGPMVEALLWLNRTWRPYQAAWKVFLERHCFAPSGGLMRGAPASPDLWDLFAAFHIDRQLLRERNPGSRRVVWSEHMTYTRYVDDLTFSTNFGGYDLKHGAIGRRRAGHVLGVVRAAGLDVNHRKSLRLDLRKWPTTTTGIRIALTSPGGWVGTNYHAPQGRAYVPRPFLSQLAGLLHRALRGDESISPDRVNGLMSVFWAPWGGRTDPSALNRRERRVLDMFERWQLAQKARR